MRNPECDRCSFGLNSPKVPRHICLMPAVKDIPEVEVVLVAEQPPMQDDTYGRIFSGKGLTEIRTFFDQNNIPTYCTFALKCARPNKDTKPEGKHVKVCAHGYNSATKKIDQEGYLSQELQHVKPKHIITFGSNAHYGATGKKCAAEKFGGRYFDERLNAYIYPTVHWIQTLYNQQVKDQMWAHLRQFVDWINGETEDVGFSPRVIVADSLKSLRAVRKRIRAAGGVVAVDTETDGLNPFLENKHVRSIQFCWDPDFGGVFVPLMVGENCYYTDQDNPAEFWTEESLEEAVDIIRDILAESQCIWHNGKFDRLWLHEWGKREFDKPIEAPNIYMDTMHVAHLINENRILKLKVLITSELGYPTYDIANKLTKNMDELIPYAARDTVATLLLAQKYVGILKDSDKKKLRRLYAKLIRKMDGLFTKMELRGWPVHKKTVVRLLEAIDTEVERVEKELYDILEKEGIEVPDKAFSSPQKMARILFDDLKYPLNPDKRIAYTPTKTRSTKSDALIHLKGRPFVDKFLEWRGLMKTRSTYVEPMLMFAESRGRISTSYRLTGAVTGRTASGKESQESSTSSKKDKSGMNLQNLNYSVYGPEKLSVKHCIRARKGWSIVEVDLSQIELRITGEVSKDPLFLRSYQEGKDIHAIRAMRILHLDEDGWAALPKADQKKARGNAKPVNFGFIYGMQAAKFKVYALTDYGVDFSMAECNQIRNKFFADHTGLEPWYGKQEREAIRLGYVESLSGRRRHLPNIKLDPDTGREARAKYNEAIRMAVNTPVQGFASDLKLMSLIEVDSFLDEEWGYLFGEVHDSILLEVRDDKVDETVRKTLKVMEHPRILDELGITLTVPICAEAKVGVSLAEAKEYVPNGS